MKSSYFDIKLWPSESVLYGYFLLTGDRSVEGCCLNTHLIWSVIKCGSSFANQLFRHFSLHISCRLRGVTWWGFRCKVALMNVKCGDMHCALTVQFGTEWDIRGWYQSWPLKCLFSKLSRALCSVLSTLLEFNDGKNTRGRSATTALHKRNLMSLCGTCRITPSEYSSTRTYSKLTPQ